MKSYVETWSFFPSLSGALTTLYVYFPQVLFALNQTLWQHEVYRTKKTGLSYTTDDLIYHYNCGDLNSIIFNHDTTQVPNLVNSSLPPTEKRTAQTIDEYFRIELLYKRNERMAERVRKLLKSHPNRSFFFAFGAGEYSMYFSYSRLCLKILLSGRCYLDRQK